MSTPEPGGVDAAAAAVLTATLDASTPFIPQFSATVATVLNNLAQVVNVSAAGAFSSPFALLSFIEKVAVFEIMDATDSLRPLAGVLPALTAAFCFSEAGIPLAKQVLRRVNASALVAEARRTSSKPR